MFSITDAQQAEFDKNGVVLIDQLIDEETVHALRKAYDDLFSGTFETGVLPDEVNWQEGTGDPSMSRQICNGWKANRTIASVITRPDFGAAIANTLIETVRRDVPSFDGGVNTEGVIVVIRADHSDYSGRKRNEESLGFDMIIPFAKPK